VSSSVQDQGENPDDALRRTVRRARSLYSAEARSPDVAEVTGELRGYLRSVIAECREMAQRTPPSSLLRRRLDGAVATAEQLLKDGPRGGAMSTVVHMQLLADSALALSANLKAAPNGATS
jgi:hypothetical protein